MRWSFWIDRGGTFTDCIGRDPRTGQVQLVKCLSEDAAPLKAIRQILGLGPEEVIPPCDLRIGTTLATNALLTRQGANCALLITRGFADLLEIGDQARPRLFELDIPRAPPLCREIVEVDARCDAQGEVLSRPQLEKLRLRLRGLRDCGVESIAISLLHAYKNPELERELARCARTEGFATVICSHECANEIGFLARTETAVAEAYLSPVISRYLDFLGAKLPGSEILVMQSNGGLVEAKRCRGADLVLSGPAGGVVASARIGAQLHQLPVLGFDMGGTSTDVSRFAGEYERRHENKISGTRLRTPAMDIHTVAAGGGSLCRYRGGRFQVGPESAGAQPGPLCYGDPEARELTLSDVNLALGRIHAPTFPFPLHRSRVKEHLTTMQEELRGQGHELTTEEIAHGFFRVACENMAEAITKISVSRGHDPREHSLVVAGGAAGQHATAVAEHLGITRVIFHPLAGALSALGIGVAPRSWHGSTDGGSLSLHELDPTGVEAIFAELESQAKLELGPPLTFQTKRQLELRYRGSESAFIVDLGSPNQMRERFEADHEREFGYRRSGHEIEVQTFRVQRTELGQPELPTQVSLGETEADSTTDRARIWLPEGGWRDIPAWPRNRLREGTQLHGPALIYDPSSTIVLDDGWTLQAGAEGVLLATHEAVSPKPSLSSDPERPSSEAFDPITLELFHNRFMGIAEQMGATLQRSAMSINIRERLDFSCALFAANGELIANAPHIPVHLGAMSDAVRAVLALHPNLQEGESFLTNDPHQGGSHLPDLTLVTPVFVAGELRFFTASRGHHADVGGTMPGSMPPDARSLADEGIVFSGIRVAKRGQLDEEQIRQALAAAPWPARRPDENVGDLRAQLAANQRGERLLLALCAQQGSSQVLAYSEYVRANAEQLTRATLAKLEDGTRTFGDAMDDQTPIKVSLTLNDGALAVDFNGTGPQQKNNTNAPPSVSFAALMYVLRCMIGGDLPLNSGCLRPVQLMIPSGSLLNPEPGHPVAAGNVETAQRVVDVLLGALELAAASQGTMNNLTFGTCDWAYYETIGGGSGAGPDFPGTSGVHTHMTNTRITDPEILERRFPVRLEQFSLRHGSGGQGHMPGGNGLIREFTFLSPVELAIVSERRSFAPYGLAGGAGGTPGQNYIDDRPVPGRYRAHLQKGQRLRIETPGGGAFGAGTRRL